MSTLLFPTLPIESCGRCPPCELGSSAITGHIELGECLRPRRLRIPELIDVADGRAVYDESFWRPQPDRTYVPEGPA